MFALLTLNIELRKQETAELRIWLHLLKKSLIENGIFFFVQRKLLQVFLLVGFYILLFKPSFPTKLKQNSSFLMFFKWTNWSPTEQLLTSPLRCSSFTANGVSLRIQSEYGKIQTRNNSVFGHSSRSECLWEVAKIGIGLVFQHSFSN